MSDTGGAAGKGGSGLLTAGLVVAVLIAAAAYIGLQGNGPTQEELTALTQPADNTVQPAPAETGTASPEDVAAAPSAETAQETVPDASEASQKPEPETSLAGESPAQDVPDDAGTPVPPSVDEVRVDADGILIVAGRAAPGAPVRVLLNGVEIASAVADGRGAFAAIASIGPSASARILTLEYDNEGVVVASAEDVILAPVAAPEPTTETVIAGTGQNAAGDGSGDAVASLPASQPATSGAADVTPSEEGGADAAESGSPAVADAPVETAETVADAGTDAAAGAGASGAASVVAEATIPSTDQQGQQDQPATVSEAGDTAQTTGSEAADPTVAGAQTQPSGGTASTSEPVTTASEQTPAPETTTGVAVLKSDEEGVTLLQTAPVAPETVQLDTIGYSDDGVVQLSGRADATAEEVRIYLDNRAVISLPLDAQGAWRGDVPDVDAGVYTLRVDAVGADGNVTSRIETPFKREEPEVLAEAAAGQSGPVRAVTVQAGDTLWAIARERYGEGLLYVRVFEANRSSIRNPDLIYPGQVFDLPADQ